MTAYSRVTDRNVNNTIPIHRKEKQKNTTLIRFFVFFGLAYMSLLVAILNREGCNIQWMMEDTINSKINKHDRSSETITIGNKEHNRTKYNLLEREVVSSHNEQKSINLTKSLSMMDPSAILAMSRTMGIDAVYIDMYEKAKTFAKKNHKTKVKESTLRYGKHQERGVIIGPTAGPNFKRYALVALKNGRRVRNIIQGTNLTNKIRVAWMASPDHISQIMNACTDNSNKIVNPPYMKEACVLWNNNTVFDDMIPTEPFPYPNKSSNNTEIEAWYKYYTLKAVQYAPYLDNLFLDSDAYPCPGFEKLFHLVDPNKSQPKSTAAFFDKVWQQPSSKAGDFVIGLEQFSNGYKNTWVKKLPLPGDPVVLQDYMTDFPQRNGGVFIVSYRKPQGLAFVHFLRLVTEYIYDTLKIELQRDQPIWRLALYLFKRFDPDFVEHLIPMHASCRAYNAYRGAGVNGFINGMYPKQVDGTHCNECHCTPCLINHNAGQYFVNLMGQQGWEDDFVWKNDYNMYKVYT